MPTWVNPRVKLMRLNKPELQKRCRAQNIEFEDGDTKGALVDKLCPVDDAKRETNALFAALGCDKPIHPEVQ